MSNRSKGVAFFIGLAFFIVGQNTYPDDEPDLVPSEALFVMCSSDRIFTKADVPINLRAFTYPHDNGFFKYDWTVSAGKIEGTGSQVKWNLAGIMPSVNHVTLQVTNGQGNTAGAQLEVIVIEPQVLMAPGYTTGRGFFIRGEQEEEGYGLYSYLLLGSRPNHLSRERYLSAISAYLKFSKATDLLEILQEKDQINITYLPLKEPLDRDLLTQLDVGREESYLYAAQDALEKYDYERAQVYLHRMEGDHLDGPYIISFRKPMSQNVLEPPYLYQDQSNVLPNLVALWMKEFILQAAQERFWERRTMYHLALKMRTYLGVMGEGVPEVMEALNTIIQLKEKLKVGTQLQDRAISLCDLKATEPFQVSLHSGHGLFRTHVLDKSTK